MSNKVKPAAAVKKKRPYRKPVIKSAEIMTFGALCNGTTNGSRKDSTGSPNFCNASKLLS